MFRTRFWPITANPINPISQVATAISVITSALDGAALSWNFDFRGLPATGETNDGSSITTMSQHESLRRTALSTATSACRTTIEYTVHLRPELKLARRGGRSAPCQLLPN